MELYDLDEIPIEELFSLDDIPEAEISPIEEIHRSELKQEWENGYRTGYRIGMLNANADLIISMVDNLQATGTKHDDAVRIVAKAMQAESYEIEMILLRNYESLRELKEDIKNYSM